MSCELSDELCSRVREKLIRMAPCRMSESLVQIAVHAQEPFCGLMTAAHFAEVGLEEGFKKTRQHELTVIDITSTTTRLIPRSNRNRVTALPNRTGWRHSSIRTARRMLNVRISETIRLPVPGESRLPDRLQSTQRAPSHWLQGIR